MSALFEFVGEKDDEPPLDVLIVDQHKSRDLQCCICLNILSQPRQCKNGHLFCLECARKCIERNPQCPQCRCNLTEEGLSRSLFVEKHLRSAEVWCRYHFTKVKKTISGNTIIDNANGGPGSLPPAYELIDWEEDLEGCKEVLTLATKSDILIRERHELTCPYGWVKCPYALHCGPQRRSQLEAHAENCPWRPLECPHCALDVAACQLSTHVTNCPRRPISCDQCGTSLLRADETQHLARDCPRALVKCEFGCAEQIERHHLAEHLRDNVTDHMALLKKAMEKQVLDLRETFDTQLKLRDDKIRHLERALRAQDTKVVWEIEDWPNARRKSYLQSKKFTMADLTWFLGCYPNGDDEETRGFVSFYLFLDLQSRTLPVGKLVSVEYQVAFVNQRNVKESVRKEFFTTFPIKGGQGWGDRKILKQNLVSQESGLLNAQNTLRIETDLTISKVFWTL